MSPVGVDLHGHSVVLNNSLRPNYLPILRNRLFILDLLVEGDVYDETSEEMMLV